LRWQKQAASNPLAHVRSVTRWRGGFVATGDLVVSGTSSVDVQSAHTKVWTSTDGRRWDPLDASVFGPASIVVGVAATSDGVMSLTMQAGRWSSNEPRTEVDDWSLTGPWQSWTAHPGPAFPPPHSAPTLVRAAGTSLVALVLDAQPLAFTRDGATWETASLDAFPGGPAGWKASSLVAFPPGYLDVGSSGAGDIALASSDGFAWQGTSLPAACPAGALVAGRSGVILVGYEGDPHGPTQTWCSSPDGRTWLRLAGYPPLGTSPEGSCRGICANGTLLGNSERMLAYRAAARQLAWTSSDGRSWTPLALAGTLPVNFSYRLVQFLLPIGLFFVDLENGSTWIGVPQV
jgi:hypothetical protein